MFFRASFFFSLTFRPLFPSVFTTEIPAPPVPGSKAPRWIIAPPPVRPPPRKVSTSFTVMGLPVFRSFIAGETPKTGSTPGGLTPSPCSALRPPAPRSSRRFLKSSNKTAAAALRPRRVPPFWAAKPPPRELFPEPEICGIFFRIPGWDTPLPVILIKPPSTFVTTSQARCRWPPTPIPFHIPLSEATRFGRRPW